MGHGLIVVGLSHHTAPVEVRERLAVAEARLAEAAREASRLAPGAAEAMIVSTCNRVEVYAGGDGEPDVLRAAVVELLARTAGLPAGEIEPYLFSHSGEAAVHHLFRVASSLDSMIVGEPQILGQVKAAFDVASSAGALTVGGPLGRAVTRAFAVAKRVRTETEVARASSSVAAAAVELARRIFGEIRGKETLVVGAGKMASLAARHLRAAGCARIVVVNRTLARAESLAREVGGEPRPWEELEPLLARADIVVCSTGAPRPVISREVAHRALKARRGRWLCFIDIAVPRDVERSVGELENVYLYDVDGLSELVDGNLQNRRREAEAAERIVEDELARHGAAERSLGVVPTIKALRERFLSVARAEADRTIGRMGAAGESHQREVRALADAIVNKLLHTPLTALKRGAESEALLDAAHTLFDLEVTTAAPSEKGIAPPLDPAASDAAGATAPAPGAAPPPSSKPSLALAAGGVDKAVRAKGDE